MGRVFATDQVSPWHPLQSLEATRSDPEAQSQEPALSTEDMVRNIFVHWEADDPMEACEILGVGGNLVLTESLDGTVTKGIVCCPEA